MFDSLSSRIQDAFPQFFAGLWQSLKSLFGEGESEWYRGMLFVQDVLWPYLVGGVLPGLVASIAAYYLTRPLIAAYQMRRRARMLQSSSLPARTSGRPARDTSASRSFPPRRSANVP